MGGKSGFSFYKAKLSGNTVLGAIIGRQMDKQAEVIKKEIQDAKKTASKNGEK